MSAGTTGGRRRSEFVDRSLQTGTVPASESQLHRVLESADRAAYTDRDQLSASRLSRLPRWPEKTQAVVRLVQGLRKVRGECATTHITTVLQEAVRISDQHRHLPQSTSLCICEQCDQWHIYHWCQQPHRAHSGGCRFQGRIQEQCRSLQVCVQHLTVCLYQYHFYSDSGEQCPDYRNNVPEHTWYTRQYLPLSRNVPIFFGNR